ncbi:MAG: NAD(P)/FAD-dependent oxidoreductase [Candidatus Krumholzibacteriota bacterium]|nr:NAD(P)/FAD-dependent oxidoreductase [Candidatus Krumholzibacteriota bacterium]
MRRKTCDVIVIGAGPAGSRVAARVAGRGFSVILLEKREKVGFPVRCAEAVGPASQVNNLIDIDRRFISSVVNGITIVSPYGRRFEIELPEIGYILDRARFDEHLASEAVRAGAVLRTSCQATGLIRNKTGISGVNMIDLKTGNESAIRSIVVVGADGVESLSPRWAGLKKNITPSEILVCAQETIEGVDVRKRFIEFHLGSKHSPGGYGWIFPKDSMTANIGVGISPLLSAGRSAVEYLDNFLEYRCPEGIRKRLVVGGCEVAKGLPELAVDGYIAVGEAANQNNPLTGGGILQALNAAESASVSVARAVEKKTGSREILKEYSRNWKKTDGRINDLFYQTAQIFYTLDDDSLEKILEGLSREPGLIDRTGVDPLRILRVFTKFCPSIAFKTLLLLARDKISAKITWPRPERSH